MKLIKLWEANIDKAYELQSTFKEDEKGFANNVFGCTFEEFKKYVDMKENYSKGIGLPEGFVPDTTFILADDVDNYVGIFNLRHYLNDFLENGPGHIGFGISHNYRMKGYATKGLSLVLQEAKKIGIDEAYLSVHKDNEGSLKAQKNNGAIIHREDDKEYYTRIKI